MKTLFLFAVFLFSTGAHAVAPKFSAFADSDNLHVTVLYNCNHVMGSLEVRL